MDEGDVPQKEAVRLRAKMMRYSRGLSGAVDDLLKLLRRYGLGALPPEADAMLGERPLTPVTAVELAVRLTVNDAMRRLEGRPPTMGG